MEPDARELEDDEAFGPDPFDEEGEASGCFGLKQRFPDRVLVMTSNACFMNCRHCTRKGLLQHAEVARSDEELSACVNYVQERPDVRDVLLSGGDPLVLPDDDRQLVFLAAPLDGIGTETGYRMIKVVFHVSLHSARAEPARRIAVSSISCRTPSHKSRLCQFRSPRQKNFEIRQNFA